MANGGHISRGSSAPRLRNIKALVGDGDPEDGPGAVGSFLSLVVLLAHRMMADQPTEIVRRAAWYDKTHPTFSDALALVRKELWAWEKETFCGSPREDDMVKVPRRFVERLTDAVCYAA